MPKLTVRQSADLTCGQESPPRVLDPCCGGRMMYFDRDHPEVLYGDRRSEVLTVTDRSRGNGSGTRTIRIEPDALIDFRDLPFRDETFHLVVFDPPHLVSAGPRSWLAAKYGRLGSDWRADIRAGFKECFRVLAPNGTLIFKWAETQIRVSELLALTPVPPLFGHPTGRNGQTHWMVFLKPNPSAGQHVQSVPRIGGSDVESGQQ